MLLEEGFKGLEEQKGGYILTEAEKIGRSNSGTRQARYLSRLRRLLRWLQYLDDTDFMVFQLR